MKSKFITKIAKYSPQILTGFGTVGVVTTSILAVKGDRKAVKIIDSMREANKPPCAGTCRNFSGMDNCQGCENISLDADDKCEYFEPYEDAVYTPVTELTPKEKFLATWKCYIPAFISCGITIFCIIKSDRISMKRSAALTGAVLLYENKLKKYQGKVLEILGKKEEGKVKDDITKDIVKETYNPNNVIDTPHGDMLCYDSYSGRYFKSNIEYIRQQLNDLSRDMLSEDMVSLNQLYDRYGLQQTIIGDMLYWHINDGILEGNFSSQLTPDGIPCLVVEYATEPRFQCL